MLEMWDLYNDKREKRGKVVPRCVPIPKGLYHLTVSAWIVNSQGQYLLLQRHPQKWLFHTDVDISEIKMQETEVISFRWVNRDVLIDMLHGGKLHPLIDYIEEIF